MSEEIPPDDPRRPLDPRDYSRRTLLANERTFLAWWRTGLTTLTVALAAARVVPELSNTATQWPYTVFGCAFGVIGVFVILYGEMRRRAVDASIRRGEFAYLDSWAGLLLTGTGVVLGVAMLILILLD